MREDANMMEERIGPTGAPVANERVPGAARVNYVDSLRAVAAIAVLAQHLFEHVSAERFRWFLELGPGVFGVILFFYVSGLVVPLSVRNKPLVAAFVARRVARIFPAYTVALVLVLAIYAATGTSDVVSALGPAGMIANLLLVSEFVGLKPVLGVSWTLSLEMLWYGLFALLFFGPSVLRHRSHTVFVAYSGFLVLASAASLALGHRIPAGRLGLLGIAFAGYATWLRLEGQLDARKYSFVIIVFASAWTIAQYVAFGIFSHPRIALHHTLVPFGAASGLFLAATHCKSLQQCLDRAALVFLGRISYSVYLFHGIVILWVAPALDSPWALVTAVPVATCVVAWLSYRLIELPGVRAGRHVERYLDRRSRLRTVAEPL